MRMSYPARIKRDGDAGYMVSFVDIPEALTGAATKSEAIESAANALTTAKDFYFEDRRAVPRPSAPKRGQVLIELPPSVAAKVLLLNAMISQGMRPIDLARRMRVRPQEVSRLTNLHHASRLTPLRLHSRQWVSGWS